MLWGSEFMLLPIPGKIRWGIFVLLLLIAVMIIPVSAASENRTVEITDVSEYSIVADDEWIIYEIIVNPVAMGKNQTHYLYYDSAEFVLTVGSYTESYIYHNFDIGLTYPNGTTTTTHAVWTGASLGTYTLDIQPVFYHAQSVNTALSVWLNVGISDPLLVEFNTLPADVCTGGDYCSKYVAAESAIPFTEASGSLGAETTVYVYEMSESEFVNNVQTYNAGYGWTALTEETVAWLISQAMMLIGLIPVFGPAFLKLMEIAGGLVLGFIWWILWLWDRWYAIIFAIEVFIALIAVVNSSKNVSLKSVGRNMYEYHVIIYGGLVWLFDKARELVTWIVDRITNIIASIK
jgi:hypothetical protein